MVRIVFALACLIASFAATAGTNAVTNVTVVVIDRAESQRRMEEARAKFNALTDAERRARMQEIEQRRQECIRRNANDPHRVISHVVNADGSITITRADGTTQTFKYVDKR